MKHSEELNELFAALSKFQRDCPKVTLDKTVNVKTRKGPGYSFKYATLAHIIETTKKTLGEYGLAVTQFVEANGAVKTMVSHESGQYILTSPLLIDAGEYDGEVYTPPSPQEMGSAITYAKRYQLSGVLGVVADEDDDGNLATGNEVTEEKPKPKKKSPAKPKKKAKPEPKEEEEEAPFETEDEENSEFEDALDNFYNQDTKVEAIKVYKDLLKNHKEETKEHLDDIREYLDKLG